MGAASYYIWSRNLAFIWREKKKKRTATILHFYSKCMWHHNAFTVTIGLIWKLSIKTTTAVCNDVFNTKCFILKSILLFLDPWKQICSDWFNSIIFVQLSPPSLQQGVEQSRSAKKAAMMVPRIVQFTLLFNKLYILSQRTVYKALSPVWFFYPHVLQPCGVNRSDRRLKAFSW